MTDYEPQMPHGSLDELFPDVFFVTGTVRPVFDGVPYQFSRNMTVVRDGESLTIFNSIRLDDAGLARLESLGTVRNIVTLGAGHGIDDPFYLDRYGARQWALPGHPNSGPQTTDVELAVGGPMPFRPAALFVYETSRRPESVMLIPRHGGILVSCDSLQNWTEADEYFSEECATAMAQMGFLRPANIGPGWRQMAQPQARDFQRLLELPFRHLLPGHGKPLRDEAKTQLRQTIEREFGQPQSGAA